MALPLVSCADSDFNFDFGMSRTEDQMRAAITRMLEAGVPPVVDHLARASGTDPVGYSSQAPGCNSYALLGRVEREIRAANDAA